MAHDYTEDLQSCIEMSSAALHVKNSAIDTLSSELESLRKENKLLAQLVSAKGAGDQVQQLVQSLQAAQLEARQLSCRLQEEIELRVDLERELEDTAAAAQELWESMQAIYSEAADSRAHSVAGTHDTDEWGTPPAAVSPVAGLSESVSPVQQEAPAAMPHAAAAGDAGAADAGAGADAAPATPVVLNPAVVAAVAAAATAPDAAMSGILTPLENKLQSLSNKLVGLVSWLDARDTPSSPGSTPHSTPTRTPATNLPIISPTAVGSSAAQQQQHHNARSGGSRVSPLLLDASPSGAAAGFTDFGGGLGSPLEGSAVSPADSSKGRSSSRNGRGAYITGSGSASKRRLSPRVLAAALAAGAAGSSGGAGTKAVGAAAGGGSDDSAAAGTADVLRVKDSSRTQ